MKLTVPDVEQYGLLAVPAYIGDKKEKQPERAGQVFHRAVKSRHTLGMDGLVTQIDAPGLKLLIDGGDAACILLFVLFFHAFIPKYPDYTI